MEKFSAFFGTSMGTSDAYSMNAKATTTPVTPNQNTVLRRDNGIPDPRTGRSGWRLHDAVRAENQDRRMTQETQMERNTRVPLVPPKPNEFDMATLIFICRAVLGT